jgi:hypothetical protein
LDHDEFMPEFHANLSALPAEGCGGTTDIRETLMSLYRGCRAPATASMRGEFGRGRRERLSVLSESEAQVVLQYLQNPVRSGLWTLRLEWTDYAGVSKFVWRSLESRFDVGEEWTSRRARSRAASSSRRRTSGSITSACAAGFRSCSSCLRVLRGWTVRRWS